MLNVKCKVLAQKSRFCGKTVKARLHLQFLLRFTCDFLLLMDVNEWISYECSDEGTCTPNIRNSSTRSHASEGENRTRNRTFKVVYKQRLFLKSSIF
jgi:hypothetical protein